MLSTVAPKESGNIRSLWVWRWATSRHWQEPKTKRVQGVRHCWLSYKFIRFPICFLHGFSRVFIWPLRPYFPLLFQWISFSPIIRFT